MASTSLERGPTWRRVKVSSGANMLFGVVDGASATWKVANERKDWEIELLYGILQLLTDLRVPRWAALNIFDYLVVECFRQR